MSCKTLISIVLSLLAATIPIDIFAQQLLPYDKSKSDKDVQRLINDKRKRLPIELEPGFVYSDIKYAHGTVTIDFRIYPDRMNDGGDRIESQYENLSEVEFNDMMSDALRNDMRKYGRPCIYEYTFHDGLSKIFRVTEKTDKRIPLDKRKADAIIREIRDGVPKKMGDMIFSNVLCSDKIVTFLLVYDQDILIRKEQKNHDEGLKFMILLSSKLMNVSPADFAYAEAHPENYFKLMEIGDKLTSAGMPVQLMIMIPAIKVENGSVGTKIGPLEEKEMSEDELIFRWMFGL